MNTFNWPPGTQVRKDVLTCMTTFVVVYENLCTKVECCYSIPEYEVKHIAWRRWNELRVQHQIRRDAIAAVTARLKS